MSAGLSPAPHSVVLAGRDGVLAVARDSLELQTLPEPDFVAAKDHDSGRALPRVSPPVQVSLNFADRTTSSEDADPRRRATGSERRRPSAKPRFGKGPPRPR